MLCAMPVIIGCASKKSSAANDTATTASLTYATCANGQTSGSVFTQNSSGVVHNHTGTACLHCHDPNLQMDINETQSGAKTAPAYSLAGTIYATNQAVGSLPSATDPAVAVGETLVFKDFTNTNQIATATTDCSGNFWVKAADDTRNMPQYYNTGSGATATATISTTTGGVSAFTVSTGGTCNGTPAFSTSGGGCTTAAMGTAIMNGSSVAAIAVSNPGRGCTSVPTVSVIAPACSTTPVASATLSGGKITATNLTNAGTCSSNTVPGVSISGLTGCATQPVLQVVMSGTTVAQIVILDQGAGCSGTPTVNFSTGCSVSPTATATYTAGQVTGVNITGGGSNYVSGGYTIKILGGGGSGAVAFAGLTAGALNTGAATLISSGTGYTSAPQVVIAPTTTSSKQAAAYYSVTVQSTNRTMTQRTDQGDCNSGNCHTNAAASTATGIRSLYEPDPTNGGTGPNTNTSGTFDPTANCKSGSVTTCYPVSVPASGVYSTLGNYTGVSPVTPVIPYRYLGKIFK